MVLEAQERMMKRMSKQKVTALIDIIKKPSQYLDDVINYIHDCVDEIVILDEKENTLELSSTKIKVLQYNGPQLLNQKLFSKLFLWEEGLKTNPDWLLVLEPDQVFEQQFKQELNQLINQNKIDVWSFRTIGYSPIDHETNTIVELVENRIYWPRLIRNTKEMSTQDWMDSAWPISQVPIHVWGKRIGYSEIKLMYCSQNTGVEPNERLSFFENQIKEGKTLSTQDLFNYGNELYMVGRYQEAASMFEKMSDHETTLEQKMMIIYKLADTYEILGMYDKETKTLIESFKYGAPQTECCLMIGLHFLQKNEMKKAIFWFETASKKGNSNMSYHSLISLPHPLLCICYYRIGNTRKLLEHYEAAKLFTNNDGEKIIDKKNRDDFQPLKIVQVAPDLYPLPSNVGGLEKIVYELTEELVNLGHDVYLFAPKGTKTRAKLIPYNHTWNATKLVEHVKNFLPINVDIIHDHTHYSSIGKQSLHTPTLSTIHTASNDIPKNRVFVSETMLKTFGHNEGGFIYNGINLNEYQYSEEKKDYFLYIGRLCQSKGTDLVLDLCEKGDFPLIMAGAIQDHTKYMNEYFPRIRKNPNINYVGCVEGQQKQDLFKNAKCVLFPTNCFESFGLVMVEAMACGTPVLALNNGSVSEVLKGFPELVCQTVDEMLDKALNMAFPHPKLLREYVETNFTTKLMVENYLAMYKTILHKN